MRWSVERAVGDPTLRTSRRVGQPAGFEKAGSSCLAALARRNDKFLFGALARRNDVSLFALRASWNDGFLGVVAVLGKRRSAGVRLAVPKAGSSCLAALARRNDKFSSPHEIIFGDSRRSRCWRKVDTGSFDCGSPLRLGAEQHPRSG
jgi:hypothetical protein